MTDHLTKEKRSWNMSRIKSSDTKPEMQIRSFLHKQGFRFRLHRKDLPGKPDIVLPKYKTVIDVRGCFWHYHKNCKRSSLPASNTAYWKNKLEGNVLRDKKHERDLKKLGWKVIVVWECSLNNRTFLTRLANKIKMHNL
ncbi:MAG: DNA mismatch endonuclease Vsr [Thermoguttaceae bacterium]|nr:DNA mismatch endonuclease Vsr [Thermoguttaceae bacterium]